MLKQAWSLESLKGLCDQHSLWQIVFCCMVKAHHVCSSICRELELRKCGACQTQDWLLTVAGIVARIRPSHRVLGLEGSGIPRVVPMCRLCYIKNAYLCLGWHLLLGKPHLGDGNCGCRKLRKYVLERISMEFIRQKKRDERKNKKIANHWPDL